jgi:hypothetical protein
VTPPHQLRAGSRRRIAALLAFAALAVLLAVPAVVGPPRPERLLSPVQVRSDIEMPGTVSLSRDCGFSTPLPSHPGRSLWLFCDTPVYVRGQNASGHVTWVLSRFIAGSTAAVGPAAAAGQPPSPLSELGTPRLLAAAGVTGVPALSGRPGQGGRLAPGGVPEPFLPAPAGLVSSAGLPCGQSGGSYAASWVTGVARVPHRPDLLVTFNDFCVIPGNLIPEGFGLAEYDPATGTLVQVATVFTRADFGGTAAEMSTRELGSPVFSGRYLYLFARCPPGGDGTRGPCRSGAVFEARVAANPSAWTRPLSYQWWSRDTPTSWTSDAAQATSIIAGPEPDGVSVTSFGGRRFVLVEQTSLKGAFAVYKSPTPFGPWRYVTSGQVTCGTATGFLNFCRAIIAHPEFSTRSQLILSYFNPATAPHGHVMMAGFRW